MSKNPHHLGASAIVMGSAGVNNFDLGSIFVAFVGACILIAILRAVVGHRVAL